MGTWAHACCCCCWWLWSWCCCRPCSSAAKGAESAAAKHIVFTPRSAVVCMGAWLRQLLDSSCSVSQLDVPLLQQTLSAAAAAAVQQEGLPVGPQLQQQLQHLHQQLQQLPCDALQPLLDALLLPGGGSTVGSTAGSTSVTTASSTSSHDRGVLSDGLAVAFLLGAAMLPRLQQLSSAAPKSLLLSLATVAEVQLDALVAVVLQPLLTGSGLVAVQAQLLIKLMKEAPQLQPRWVRTWLQPRWVRTWLQPRWVRTWLQPRWVRTWLQVLRWHL
ncbi:hypothetical protein COO60DRAFT_916242 [Scenedesmus sp. NREL 46B-D3]|nr:hypothetical protein COO60DRAFT_916242 [Scenedesmus sp. NREL 46B-D3]